MDNFHASVDEFVEGFAFQEAVAEQREVGELAHELFLFLLVLGVQYLTYQRVVDVHHKVVALGHLAVESHSAAADHRHLFVTAHKLVLGDDHRLVALL